MVNPNVAGFNPGGIPDRIDHRDHKWSEVGFGSSPFNWDVGYDAEKVIAAAIGNPLFKIPVKDQDGSGSCGGQAWAYLAGTLEALATKTFEERSAKFIYAQTHVPGGGSQGRDNCDVFIKQGVAREAVLSSYDAGMPPGEAFMERSGDITAAMRQDAALSRALSYAQVDDNAVDTVAQAIRDNSGVVIGISGQNNGTWNSPSPKPPTTIEWRHWIYACRAKMINGVKNIGFINSWGTAAGEAGWQWLPEEWFKTLVNGAPAIFSKWTQVYNPLPVPPIFHHVFNVDMKLGDSGPEVIALQQALQVDGTFSSTVPATGYFGNLTLAALVKFQIKYKISPAIGFCGPVTRIKLNSLFGS